LTGFVNATTYQQPSGIELLNQDGGVLSVAYGEIKSVSFVKDFENAREPLEARVFQTRPKMEGLWVRLKFRDGEVLDGVLPNNLLQLDRQGYTITPPEPYANNQKVFIPRDALISIQVVGVVGSPLRRSAAKPRVRPGVDGAQPGLFE